LENGVRIVTETMPHVRSLAIGIWFDTGSRDEPEELAGISHFLEHMNFKGTAKRSALVIPRQIEGKGGHLNAFTGQEVTCFYARVISQHLNDAVDVLSDMTQNSLFDQAELDRERDVILEELKNNEDTPDELVFDHFMSQVFEGDSMGRPVIGTREALARINQPELKAYRAARYGGSRVVIVAAGYLDHDRLVRMISKRFIGDIEESLDRNPVSMLKVESPRRDFYTTTQQTHIVWGCRSYPYHDSRKYGLMVLNTLLGGGASSRLFQRIRERHGLAYSVYSFLSNHSDCGVFGVYAGTEPKKAEKTLSLIEKEIKSLVKTPVSKRELTHYKEQLKGSLLLGLESPSSMMHRLAKMEMYTGQWYSIDDVVKELDKVTSEQIQEIAIDLFEANPTCTTMLMPQ
jgi:predicted Zn-dependent peptidase